MFQSLDNLILLRYDVMFLIRLEPLEVCIVYMRVTVA